MRIGTTLPVETHVLAHQPSGTDHRESNVSGEFEIKLQIYSRLASAVQPLTLPVMESRRVQSFIFCMPQYSLAHMSLKCAEVAASGKPSNEKPKLSGFTSLQLEKVSSTKDSIKSKHKRNE